MKKTCALLLCLCLCLLTACQGREQPSTADPGNNVSAPPSGETSSSASVTPAAALEPSPLSVAVQIVAEYENPEVYSLGENAGFTLGTQKNL